ncbi:hypothetical protein GOB39_00540 [Sinorhizobium meliloti]|nr:hypothetical protein [Sinorhizobium meliloti]
MSSIPDAEIKNLAVGEVFYECEMFMNVEARVTEAPTPAGEMEGRPQWRWKAVNTQNGKEIDYLLTEGFSHYGPRLYRRPQYARLVDGKPEFPLLGSSLPLNARERT